MKTNVSGAVSRVIWQTQNGVGFCYIDFHDRHPELSATGGGDGRCDLFFSRGKNENYATVELIPETKEEEDVLARTPYHTNAKDYFEFAWPPYPKDVPYDAVLYDSDSNQPSVGKSE